MHKGISFVVTVGREAAAFLTNPAEDPAMRAGCLAELVQAGQAQAGGSHVRRGQVAVMVLAVVPGPLAYWLLADEPRHRRRQMARVVTCESFLFCGASLAAHDAPAVTYCGVPLADVRRAEAAYAALESAWSPDTRIYAADETPVSRAAL